METNNTDPTKQFANIAKQLIDEESKEKRAGILSQLSPLGDHGKWRYVMNHPEIYGNDAKQFAKEAIETENFVPSMHLQTNNSQVAYA